MNIKLLGLSLIGCVLLSGCAIKNDNVKTEVKKQHEYVILKTKNKSYEFNVDDDNDKRILETPTTKRLTKVILKDLKVKNNKTLTVTDDIDVLTGNNVSIDYYKDLKTNKIYMNLELINYEYDSTKESTNIRTERHSVILEKDVAILSNDHSALTGVVWFSK